METTLDPATHTTKPPAKPATIAPMTIAPTPTITPMIERLSMRERLFVEAYIGTAGANGAKAAETAGYAHGAQAAYKLLKREDVKAAIVERYNDVAMPANEVLARLAGMARATLADALDEDGKVSLSSLIESGLIHQVQEIRFNEHGPIIKLTDRQGALDKIARALGLYQGDGAGVTVIIKDLRGVDVEAV